MRLSGFLYLFRYAALGICLAGKAAIPNLMRLNMATLMALPDYYKILGLTQASSQDEIKRAFRKLAKETHPDVCKDIGANDRFVEINEAYAILSDPEKRKSYHTQLIRQRENLSRPYAQRTQERQTTNTTSNPSRDYNEWVRQARERADREARMNWKDFERTRFDETELRMYFVLQIFMFGFAGFLSLFIMLFPILLMFNFHWTFVFFCLGTVPLGMKLMVEAQKGLKAIKVIRK